ncbi:hypothetical protein, partial [Nostoc sp.]|uniref:hypothetical protein n=1 Tax=Nostoc sp. TaxID=1180 RepID=UPI002FFA5B09
VEVLQTPVEVLQTPVEVLQTPVEVLQTPVEVLQTRVEVLQTRVEVLRSRVEVLQTLSYRDQLHRCVGVAPVGIAFINLHKQSDVYDGLRLRLTFKTVATHFYFLGKTYAVLTPLAILCLSYGLIPILYEDALNHV